MLCEQRNSETTPTQVGGCPVVQGFEEESSVASASEDDGLPRPEKEEEKKRKEVAEGKEVCPFLLLNGTEPQELLVKKVMATLSQQCEL